MDAGKDASKGEKSVVLAYKRWFFALHFDTFYHAKRYLLKRERIPFALWRELYSNIKRHECGEKGVSLRWKQCPSVCENVIYNLQINIPQLLVRAFLCLQVSVK